jgi:hypothetical protein
MRGRFTRPGSSFGEACILLPRHLRLPHARISLSLYDASELGFKFLGVGFQCSLDLEEEGVGASEDRRWWWCGRRRRRGSAVALSYGQGRTAIEPVTSGGGVVAVGIRKGEGGR